MSRPSRVGDQRSRWSEDGGETPGDAAASADERIVTAGIEDRDVQRRNTVLHRLQHLAQVDGRERHVPHVPDVGSDRDQVVLAIDLYAVAGIVEQADAVGGPQAPGEIPDGAHHRALVGIQHGRHREADRRQRGSDQLGVVAGIGEAPLAIGGVADDQGGSRLGPAV